MVADALRESLDKPFAQIPAFIARPVRRRFASWSAPFCATGRGIAAETERLTAAGKTIPPDLMAVADPIGRLRELCNAARKDYVAIAVEADALTRSGKAMPADLKPVAAEAVKRMNCRDAVQAALDAKNPRGVKAVFHKSLLEGWADRKLITDAEAALEQVEVLDKLQGGGGGSRRRAEAGEPLEGGRLQGGRHSRGHRLPARGAAAGNSGSTP